MPIRRFPFSLLLAGALLVPTAAALATPLPTFDDASGKKDPPPHPKPKPGPRGGGDDD